MSISSSLYSGVSGLNTNGNAMSVLGNNIANTNTVGFKSSRTVFSDLMASTISGSGGLSQVGRGTQLATVDNIFSQGTFENTQSNSDLAIEGESFFMVKRPGNETMYYTRAGSFRFNGEGYLINPEGLRVQGKPFENGLLSAGDPQDIRVVAGNLLEAKATENIKLTTNLNANAVVPTEPFDPSVLNPASYNYTTSTRVYDSLGNTHLLSTYFVKSGENTWDWHVLDEKSSVVASSLAFTNPDGTPGTAGTPLGFNATGNLVSGGTADTVAINWANGSAAQPVTVTFNTTQYSSASIVLSQDQDGFGAGSLVNVAIDGSGIVTASYSNGEQIKIAQITLAKFPNPGGLMKEGGNLFSASDATGPARIGIPDAELGKIFTNALEQSNVDLAQEFVKMIILQRGFQASSKIISTTDELLGELINLKR